MPIESEIGDSMYGSQFHLTLVICPGIALMKQSTAQARLADFSVRQVFAFKGGNFIMYSDVYRVRPCDVCRRDEVPSAQRAASHSVSRRRPMTSSTV